MDNELDAVEALQTLRNDIHPLPVNDTEGAGFFHAPVAVPNSSDVPSGMGQAASDVAANKAVRTGYESSPHPRLQRSALLVFANRSNHAHLRLTWLDGSKCITSTRRVGAPTKPVQHSIRNQRRPW